MKLTVKDSMRRITISMRSPDAHLMRSDPEEKVAEPIFKQLAERFSSYLVVPERITMMLPIGHPDAEELLRVAIGLGLRISKHQADRSSQVKILDYRAYSENEINSALLLECECHSQFIASLSDWYQSGFAWKVRDFKRYNNKQFGAIVNLYHLLVVRGSAKATLEASGLKGLKLMPLQTEAQEGAWPEGIEPLFLLWSDEMLPMVDSDLFDNHNRVFRSEQRDLTQACYLLNGNEINPQLRYRDHHNSSFDVALTVERFGGVEPPYHKLVYSQKARKILQGIDKNLIFKPVIIG